MQVSQTNSNFDVAPDGNAAEKYWEKHVLLFLKHAFVSECSYNFLDQMTTDNNEQQCNSNTATSDPHFSDPTVVTDERNNYNSRNFSSCTSSFRQPEQRSNETAKTSTNCTSSSSEKPSANNDQKNKTEKKNRHSSRNKSKNQQGNHKGENYKKLSTTTSKNSTTTSKRSAKTLLKVK